MFVVLFLSSCAKVPVVSHNAGSIPDDDMGAPMRRLEEHILTALLRNSNDDPKTAKGRSAKCVEGDNFTVVHRS